MGKDEKIDSPCDVGVVIPISKETPKEDQPKKPKRRPAARPESKSGPVVDAYFAAMERVYGSTPIRSAKINAMACRIVDEIGAEDAPGVVGFYVSHRNSWYVSKGHGLEWCLKDIQKLRLEYLNGVQITAGMAQTVDRESTIDQGFEQYRRMRSQMEAGF